MSHEDLRDRLYSYYDGELSGRDRRAVESHLSSCADCRAILDRWKGLAGALLQGARVGPSEEFVRRVMASLPEERATVEADARPAFRWLAPALSFATAAVVLILAWPGGNAPIASESLILADGPEELSSLLAFSPQAPTPEDLLGYVLEEP